MNYGLQVLESAFEHLDIKAGNSDSEDEEVPDKVDAILEPKVGTSEGLTLAPDSICPLYRPRHFIHSGPVRGQTPPVSDWLQGFHGAR